jgi:DNA-binding MarR family transcriptional regulator
VKHTGVSVVNRSKAPLTTGPGFRLRTAFDAIHRELGYYLTRHGIATAHYFYLRALYEEDGLTQVELAERVGVKPATATGVIDTMESLGLVRRVRHKTDRRKLNVFLTAHGKAMRRPLLESLDELNRVILRGVSEQQWKAFCDVLDTMVANVTNARAS